jgi:hypothetical protein
MGADPLGASITHGDHRRGAVTEQRTSDHGGDRRLGTGVSQRAQLD